MIKKISLARLKYKEPTFFKYFNAFIVKNIRYIFNLNIIYLVTIFILLVGANIFYVFSSNIGAILEYGKNNIIEESKISELQSKKNLLEKSIEKNKMLFTSKTKKRILEIDTNTDRTILKRRLYEFNKASQGMITINLISFSDDLSSNSYVADLEIKTKDELFTILALTRLKEFGYIESFNKSKLKLRIIQDD